MKNESPQTPRVHISYNVESAGRIEVCELPFVTGVLADLSSTPAEPLPDFRDRPFVSIDRDNFDHVLESVSPRVVVRVPCTILQDKYGSELTIALTFQSLADFSPGAIASCVPPVSELLAVHDGLRRIREEHSGKLREILVLPNVLAEVLGDLESVRNPLSSHAPGVAAAELLNAAQAGPSPEDRISAAAWLSDLLGRASRGKSRDPEAILLARLAWVDHAMARQLDEVLHHPDFQRLEATWRALRYFVDQTETSEFLQIRALNVSKGELLLDMEQAVEFDQSRIYKKLYEEVYGVFRRPPFAMLIGDYYFDGGVGDMNLLARLGQVAAESNIVFLAGAATEVYATWRQFSQSEAAPFVGLVLPRVFLRPPYDWGTVERFAYKERVTEHKHYLWGNAAFALGARVADSFARFGWWGAIRGTDGVGRFLDHDGCDDARGPAEIVISEEREAELSGSGFIPLLCDRHTNAAARASASLDRVLAASRFAHYLRCMIRDLNGSFMSAEDCEVFCNRWIDDYVLREDFADPFVKAKCPLVTAKVEVSGLPETPGVYRMILEVIPAFQFEDMSQSTPVRLAFTCPASRFTN